MASFLHSEACVGRTHVKILCALIGAFFLVGGIVILVAGPPKTVPRVGLTAAERSARAAGHRPLVWEADGVRPDPAGPRAAAEAAARNR